MVMRGMGRIGLAAPSTRQPCKFRLLIYSCNAYKSNLIVIIAALQPILLRTPSAIGTLLTQMLLLRV
jgi:hypothetical protein